MRKATFRYIIFASLMFAVSCNSNQASTIDKDKLKAEVKSSMDGMVTAWNAHKLEEAFAHYWNSPEMLWINRTGVNKGYQSVLDGYLRDFEDRSNMGSFGYEFLHQEVFSDSVVFTTVRWSMEVKDGSTYGGVSSFVWKKKNGKWVIAAEHAS